MPCSEAVVNRHQVAQLVAFAAASSAGVFAAAIVVWFFGRWADDGIVEFAALTFGGIALIGAISFACYMIALVLFGGDEE